MSPALTRIVAVLAVAGLGGCAGLELEKARGVAPAGTAFERSLYEEYMTVATDEYGEGDYGNSDIYALRGVAAARGAAASPEAMSARQIPSRAVAELRAARQRLADALRRNATTKIPDQAAHAQVMFECWMEEQEEDIQPKDIAACRAAFGEAMAKVDAAMKPAPVAAKPKPAPAPQPAPVPKPTPVSRMVAQPAPLPEPFIVYFAFDSGALNLAGQGVVERAADAIESVRPSSVTIAGHTDRAGAPKYNLVLSKRRVDAVAAALVAAGVSPPVIAKSIHGEDSPDVATSDGVREWRNRRAVITLAR
jgi:outer membrane protein OmpA-like peptidoglycan-associated protein